MKMLTLHTETTKIIRLFLSFLAVTFIGGGLVLHGLLRIPAPLANMVAAVGILIITYIAYKKEGKDLSALGLDFRVKNLLFIVAGFIIGGLFVFPLVYTFAYIKGYPVVFNQHFNPTFVLNGLLLSVPTVLLEELAFRGICFQKAVQLKGARKANLIFAGMFILSHWLNVASFNPLETIVLLITGLGHLLYATAFLRSGTLYFPIALHLGNNWINNFVFAGSERIDNADNLSLINIITGGKKIVMDSEFLLTTCSTAVLFILLIWCVNKIKRARKPC